MEIVHLINDIWQLIDASGTVVVQGSRDKCLDKLCELESHSEYLDFLRMSGI